MKRLAVSLLLLFVFVFIASAEEWSGADDMAKEEISKIAPDYKPWFSPIWEPPSGEIESFLFSLQAAIGALLIGYFLGYYRGKRAVNR